MIESLRFFRAARVPILFSIQARFPLFSVSARVPEIIGALQRRTRFSRLHKIASKLSARWFLCIFLRPARLLPIKQRAQVFRLAANLLGQKHRIRSQAISAAPPAFRANASQFRPIGMDHIRSAIRTSAAHGRFLLPTHQRPAEARAEIIPRLPRFCHPPRADMISFYPRTIPN